MAFVVIETPNNPTDLSNVQLAGNTLVTGSSDVVVSLPTDDTYTVIVPP